MNGTEDAVCADCGKVFRRRAYINEQERHIYCVTCRWKNRLTEKRQEMKERGRFICNRCGKSLSREEFEGVYAYTGNVRLLKSCRGCRARYAESNRRARQRKRPEAKPQAREPEERIDLTYWREIVAERKARRSPQGRKEREERMDKAIVAAKELGMSYGQYKAMLRREGGTA